MFVYKKIQPQKIYSDSNLHRSLSRLTNAGNDFIYFGSFMLESLNTNNTIKDCFIAKEDTLGIIVGWSSIVLFNDKLILNVFVHKSYRQKGIGKKLLKLILKEKNNDEIYFSPISDHGFSLINNFITEKNCLN